MQVNSFPTKESCLVESYYSYNAINVKVQYYIFSFKCLLLKALFTFVQTLHLRLSFAKIYSIKYEDFLMYFFA